MNYILKSSLEGSALVKVAYTFWIQDLDSLLECELPWDNERRVKFNEVEGNVLKRVAELKLPESLIRKLSDHIGPIGQQILIWKNFHDNLLNDSFGKDILSQLCWTPCGTVDYSKTAKLLIQGDNFGIYDCCKLASIYCLEDYLHILWPQLEKVLRLDLSRRDLVSIGYHYIINAADLLPNGYECAFNCSVVDGNETAARYFLEKLAPERRVIEVMKYVGPVSYRRTFASVHDTSFPKQCYSSILCFLLSSLNEEKQLEAFKTYHCHYILKCLLDWPWQEFFLETVNCMKTIISEENFHFLLIEIASEVMGSYRDYKYQKIFETFWQQGTVSHKKFVMQKLCLDRDLLILLVRAGDIQNIKLILKDANVMQKEELIFSYTGKSVCETSIECNNRELLNFFIHECISSERAANKFVGQLKEHISFYRANEIEEDACKRDKWKKGCNLLDEIEQSYKKKKGRKMRARQLKKK